MKPTAAPTTRDDSAVEPGCLNCGAVLVGPYCAACGQRDQPLRQPVGGFFAEAFTEFFGVDGRVWRSVGALLLRPGKLTVDYVEGRRTQALRPLRLYLTATLLFFVALSFVDEDNETTRGAIDGLLGSDSLGAAGAPDTSAVAQLDSLMESGDLLDLVNGESDAVAYQKEALVPAVRVLSRLDSAATHRADSLVSRLDEIAGVLARAKTRLEPLADTVLVSPAALGVDGFISTDVVGYSGSVGGDGMLQPFIGWLPDWMKGKLARDVEQAETRAEREAASEALKGALAGQVPTTLLVLMPVYALLLKLLYLGGGGVEPRARRRRVPPLDAPAGASRVRRARTAVRTGWWRVRTTLDRWAARRRIRRRRRWWRRWVRDAREALSPRRVRVARVAWLRRAVTSRRPRYFAEHVVFALHVHAFLFTVLFVAVVTPGDDGILSAIQSLMGLSIPFYFLFAQRRVYAQTWGRTLAKAVWLGVAYIVLGTGGFFLATALAARVG